MDDSDALFDKEKAQERLAKLSGGVAVFKVYFIFEFRFSRANNHRTRFWSLN